jgi:hypothetical protein
MNNTTRTQVNTALKEMERYKLTEELIQVRDALNGMKKADAFVFYEDADGRGRVLFLDNLQGFPFDLNKELKILLEDANDIYTNHLNNFINE